MKKNNSIACKICNKCFSSGKAIGGHMRSHLVKLPIPPKHETKDRAPDNSAELTHCPVQSASSPTYAERKPTQNFRPLKGNFFQLANSNRENESGSCPKTPTRKRSKCHRKFIAAAEMKAESKQESSRPDSFSVEEAARSLLMLSKDKWPKRKEIKTQKKKKTNKMEVKDGESCRDDLLVQTQSRSRFECKRCGKTFQSYQALCGHKASHKKDKNLSDEDGNCNNNKSGIDSDAIDQKVFKCPYCSKKFKTAQALGGHKRVHLSNNMTGIAKAQTTANLQFGGKLVVDLNFPPPKEDEQVSHIAISREE